MKNGGSALFLHSTSKLKGTTANKYVLYSFQNFISQKTGVLPHDTRIQKKIQ
jgi:hypothetical protein